MRFIDLAKKRYSARSYQNRAVEPDKLNEILEAGRVAPTACNNQPQRIIVVQSPKGLVKIKKAYKTFGAPLALIVCANHQSSWKRRYDSKNSADIDVSIITSHMMLCATDLGLDSVWVCAFDPDIIKMEFNIPNHIEPVNILFIGYADGESKSPQRHDETRKPLNETVFYETF